MPIRELPVARLRAWRAERVKSSPALTLSTHGHVMAEYADAERIDAEAEIAAARRRCLPRVRQTTADYVREPSSAN